MARPRYAAVTRSSPDLLDGECPASDYGGIGGRFHDREYTLGQAMAWWPRDHTQWSPWQLPGAAAVSGEEYDEACYSKCTACGADVVIRFEHCTPFAVLSVSREDDWPDDYPR